MTYFAISFFVHLIAAFLTAGWMSLVFRVYCKLFPRKAQFFIDLIGWVKSYQFPSE